MGLEVWGVGREILNVLMLWCLVLFRGGEVATTDSRSVIEKMRSGMRFSMAVDVRPLLEEFPEARSAIMFLDSMSLSSESCYAKVVAESQANCETADETMQRFLALRFTYCFYEAVGRKRDLPDEALPDDEKVHRMSRQAYASYKKFGIHWANLCRFAKQTLFNEMATEHLVSVFESIVNSSQAVAAFSKALGLAAGEISGTAEALHQSVLERDAQLKEVSDRLNVFGTTFDKTLGLIAKPLEHIEGARRFLVLVAAVCVALVLAPARIFPLTVGACVIVVGDMLIGARYGSWRDSWVRTVLKLCLLAFLAVAFLAPIVTPFARILAFFRRVGQPAIAVPRIQAQPRSRPRAY